jgi:hypothetical protein
LNLNCTCFRNRKILVIRYADQFCLAHVSFPGFILCGWCYFFSLSAGHLLDSSDLSYFVYKWRGLNADVTLNSVKEVRLRVCPRNISLSRFLSGEVDAGPGEATVPLQDAVASLLAWDESWATRTLVSLDAHCVDGVNVVFGLSRAFPVPME